MMGDREPIVIQGMSGLIASTGGLLGYEPAESVVVVPVVMAPGLPVARVDLPVTDRDVTRTVASLAPVYRDSPAALVVMAYTRDQYAGAAAVRQVADGINPRAGCAGLVVVDGDDWVRLDMPDVGTVTQADRDRVGVEMAYHWSRSAPYTTREALAATWAPRACMVPQDLIEEHAPAAQIAAEGGRAGQVEQEWMAGTLSRYLATGQAVSDPDAARLIADIQHLPLRDHAVSRIERADLAGHAELWKDIATRTPAALIAPSASIAAYTAWMNGDGVNARMALDQIPSGTRYNLGSLVGKALDRAVDPSKLPLMSEMPDLNSHAHSPAPANVPSPGAAMGRRQPPTLGTQPPSPGVGR